MTILHYTHRNGETDLPTITGHFWVDRTLTQVSWEPEPLDQYDVVHVAYEYTDENRSGVENIHIFVPGVQFHVDPDEMPDGVRWWGPVPSPLNNQNAILTFKLTKEPGA